MFDRDLVAFDLARYDRDRACNWPPPTAAWINADLHRDCDSNVV